VKVIFLDIDGVLNYTGCKEMFGRLYGVDDDRLDKLAKIVQSTDAAIVLTSTWKQLWDNQPLNSDTLDPMALYLLNRLKSRGLRLTDRTTEKDPSQRGHGIKAWLRKVPDIESWVVLDDDMFPDYKECGIVPRLVRTRPDSGLTDENVDKAIRLLNGE